MRLSDAGHDSQLVRNGAVLIRCEAGRQREQIEVASVGHETGGIDKRAARLAPAAAEDLGGEAAQTSLQISDKVVRAFQGILLFFVLASDTLILYRIRLVMREGKSPEDVHANA